MNKLEQNTYVMEQLKGFVLDDNNLSSVMSFRHTFPIKVTWRGTWKQCIIKCYGNCSKILIPFSELEITKCLSNANGADPDQTASSEAVWSCLHCLSRPFRLSTSVQNFITLIWWHNLRSHTGDKQFKCDEYPECFSHKNNLKRHLKAPHNKVLR